MTQCIGRFFTHVLATSTTRTVIRIHNKVIAQGHNFVAERIV